MHCRPEGLSPIKVSPAREGSGTVSGGMRSSRRPISETECNSSAWGYLLNQPKTTLGKQLKRGDSKEWIKFVKTCGSTITKWCVGSDGRSVKCRVFRISVQESHYPKGKHQVRMFIIIF